MLLPADPGSLRIPIRWAIGGSFLLLFFLLTMHLSSQFDDGIPREVRPYWLLVCYLSLAGFAWLYLMGLVIHTPPRGITLGWIVMLGCLMRLAALCSAPILEDDYYRYLWDGAVSASGVNPYAHAPEEVQRSLEGADPGVPAALVDLARQPGSTLARINHAYLRTIYPPVTQFFFALSWELSPWNLLAWRLTLLLADIITAMLLVLLLRHLALSPLWIGVYWINPLLVKEIVNSAHMDVLVFPFLLACLLLAFRNYPLWAAVFLALAAGVKIWPLLLFPLIFRPFLSKPRQLSAALLILTGTSLFIFFPMLQSGLDGQAGLAAYSQRWQLNDTLFSMMLGLWQYLYSFADLQPGWAHLYAQYSARGSIALLILALLTYYSWGNPRHAQETIRRCLLVVTAIFMLSPTQFPWYALWLLPFLALFQRRSLFMLTAFLPLYYLWHYYDTIGRTDIFNRWIVWLEFLPVWLLFLHEAYIWYRSRPNTPIEVAHDYEERLPHLRHHSGTE